MLLLGACFLALEPMVWLSNTWIAPGYDGVGWLAAALVVVVFIWSGSSSISKTQVAFEGTPTLKWFNPFWALLISAALRLGAQILDVSILGALLLCVDIFAVASLFRLPARERSASPFWLGVLFLFALPIEPLIQRLVGYGLQHLSADIACLLILPWVEDLACQGVRIVAAEKELLVDIPCSGSELLSIVGLSLALINCVTRPNLASAFFGIVVAICAALAVNSLRIMVIALGLVHEPTLGFSMMSPIPHNLIGLVMTALAVSILVLAARKYRRPSFQAIAPARAPMLPRQPKLVLSGAFLFFALSVGAIQPRPIDASPELPPPLSPRVAADFLKTDTDLTPIEKRYFATYGGSATRSVYGPHTLLVVTTESPLRHLHDPAICLKANGLEVELVGTNFDISSTVYRVTSDRAIHEVRVSYISNKGDQAVSVSEMVWRWLRSPGSRWSMVQRILPASTQAGAENWDAAIRRAYNVKSEEA